MYRNDDVDYIRLLKKKDVIIYGAGEQGKQGFYKLRKEGIKVVAFCDNNREKQNHLFCETKVVSFENLCEINNEKIMIVLCSRFEREMKEQLLERSIYNNVSISQIDFGGAEGHYDESYFDWQKRIGEFGARLSAKAFQPFIKEDMVVVEFGSGGGYLLNNLSAKEKKGIEINDIARQTARQMGIDSVKNISEIPDDYADIIISTHVLEHVMNPFGALCELRDKLKDGGMVVFHVPNEPCDTEYVRSEVNNHLYTWNCLTLGNLFKAAGYFVYSVQNVQEVWPRHFLEVEREVSPQLFEDICEIGGRAFNENRCIIVAYK